MTEDRTALYAFIEMADDDNEPDGAWWAILEDSVVQWNEINGTDYDAYLRSVGKDELADKYDKLPTLHGRV